MANGILYGIGVGPGDPELLTMKAVKAIGEADIIAYPTANGTKSNAKTTIEPYLKSTHQLMPLTYPVTAGPIADSAAYQQLMQTFYDQTAAELDRELATGKTVAIICAGDPFVFGSYMYWHARLAEKFETIVIPGISSILAAPVSLGMPLCHREDIVSIIPGTLSEAEISKALVGAGSAVIMKLGRTFEKVRRAVAAAGLTDNAYLVERATMSGERILPISMVNAAEVPYFSLVVIPCEKPE